MRDRPMGIRELGFLSLNSRDDFAVLKNSLKREFAEEYLKAQQSDRNNAARSDRKRSANILGGRTTTICAVRLCF